jgi:hypothetical protein
MGRGWPAAAIALALVAGLPSACLTSAWAQPAQWLRLQPPPVDLTTPPDNDPQRLATPDRAAPDDCAPAWPCRLRLFGTLGAIDKYGGVGLKGPALTW